MAENGRDSKELKSALSMISKEFGEGAIMSLGEITTSNVEGISTGALSLDLALGGKGLPRGRVVEIYGNESSGKTTIALHAIANVQRQGGVAAFIDAEHALDPTWAKRIGVDLDSLLVSQPTYGEEALRIAEMLVKSNAVDVIVIDSVAALVPKNELNNEIGDPSVGQQARLMSQALRILNPSINKTRTCMIFINQIRQKIGVMYGNPETTTGGLALKFYASVRLEVRKSTVIKDGDEPVGSEIKVKVVKNKIAPPFKTAEFSLMHNRGIDLEDDVLKVAVEDDILTKAGAFFSYKDQRLGQGKENAKVFLRENPTVRDAIIAEVVAKHAAATAASISGAVAIHDRDEDADHVNGDGEANGEAALPPPPAPKKRGKAAAE
jgi:recombination protein RecA